MFDNAAIYVLKTMENKVAESKIYSITIQNLFTNDLRLGGQSKIRCKWESNFLGAVKIFRFVKTNQKKFTRITSLCHIKGESN